MAYLPPFSGALKGEQKTSFECRPPTQLEELFFVATHKLLLLVFGSGISKKKRIRHDIIYREYKNEGVIQEIEFVWRSEKKALLRCL